MSQVQFNANSVLISKELIKQVKVQVSIISSLIIHSEIQAKKFPLTISRACF